jgi:hypothetical protein
MANTSLMAIIVNESFARFLNLLCSVIAFTGLEALS